MMMFTMTRDARCVSLKESILRLWLTVKHAQTTFVKAV